MEGRSERPQHPELNGLATPSPDACSHHFCHFTPKCFLTVHRGEPDFPRANGTSVRSTPSHFGEDGWHEGTTKTTIRVENEVEAQREANNYKFGFRKWKGNVTERPIEDRSEIVKELYTDLSIVKPREGSVVTVGNIAYVFLFGWWISLFYILICPLMFLTIFGAPYGKLCLKMALYLVWPFGKAIVKGSDANMKPTNCERISSQKDDEDLAEDGDCAPLLVSSPILTEIPVPPLPEKRASNYWCRVSTYIWLLLGYPVLAVVHFLACVLSWLPVFSIPVAKMNFRILTTVLLMAPEEVQIKKQEMNLLREIRVTLYCCQAFNMYYYKYTIQGINIFALNLLPLVFMTLIVGYTDHDHAYLNSETMFAIAITSIIPLSYYIGMGIASISAQSNFAVGAVVNCNVWLHHRDHILHHSTAAGAPRWHQMLRRNCQSCSDRNAARMYFVHTIILPSCVQGICMTIGGIKHSEQRFNSRSAGVSSALLFISVGGVFAPTLFSKTFGNLVCESCSNIPGNTSVPFTCKDCHYDTSKHKFIFFPSSLPSRPLVYTISVLLPASYLIGLIFTLKTHSHIYDIHISEGHGGHSHGHHPVVHWSRWKALAVLIVATALMACCADLCTENIEPILTHSSISQYFIGVTVLAMVPELPEIVNGIQFALQNNISLSLEVGSCIAVQVTMIQIPLLILFNAFYDVGFILVFSDIHLWASIFSVILVNYIFMDGKCDYFQGTALVVVYLILLALYFFAPSPRSC
ncbi:Low affinity vacuolar monovalent cation/H(+) antiporter [Oryzias melastigma]|uniref:Low affinity vacuolar monovalent cation/H(+) antiporter n=1 Tax=Oryzias melastigma TaxID=30732 RepID=A0A834KTX9_ORYME|nr:Low affinity vacuolar monovalent cation/H(+) antiporter [Oryzias melastigma]